MHDAERRMLGSHAEAQDAVQESWIRASRAGADDVANIGGWLTTIVARQCLNMLRSRASRGEESLDVHLPDPVVSAGDGTTGPGSPAALSSTGVPGWSPPRAGAWSR